MKKQEKEEKKRNKINATNGFEWNKLKWNF